MEKGRLVRVIGALLLLGVLPCLCEGSQFTTREGRHVTDGIKQRRPPSSLSSKRNGRQTRSSSSISFSIKRPRPPSVSQHEESQPRSRPTSSLVSIERPRMSRTASSNRHHSPDECSHLCGPKALPTGKDGKCDFDVKKDSEYLPEPDFLECVQRRPSQVWADEREGFYRYVERLQNPENCAEAEGDWHVLSMESFGVGAVLKFLMKAVQMALSQGVPVIMSNSMSRYGDESGKCGRGYMCGLRELSRCKIEDIPLDKVTTFIRPNEDAPEWLSEACKPHGAYNVTDGRCHCHDRRDVPVGRHPDVCVRRKSLQGRRGPHQCLKELDMKGPEAQFDSSLTCWHNAAPGRPGPEGRRPRLSLAYRRAESIKPNLTLQSSWKFQEPMTLAWMFNSTYLRNSSRPPAPSSSPGCIALHIRRGDACIKGGSMGGSYFHRTCFPVESYLKQIKRLVRLYGPRPVYLASDSEEVVQPLREGLREIGGGMELMVQHMDRSKYDSDTHIDFRPEISGSAVTLEVLQDIYSMSDCDVFLGSMASTMYELAWMLAAGRKGYFPPFVSMETPMGDQHLWWTYPMYYPGGELHGKSNCKCYKAPDKARPKKCRCKGLL